MARKNIFDLIKDSTDIHNDIKTLHQIFFSETMNFIIKKEHDSFGKVYNLTLYQIINDYLFKKWEYRGHFSNFDDFLMTIEYDTHYLKATENQDIDSFIFLIEFYYNLLFLAKPYLYSDCDNYFLMNTIIKDCLDAINYKLVDINGNDKYIVVEDKPEVTAVAEIVEPDFALEMIRYNHYTLKGDIKEKQRILKIMADAIEAKQKELKSVDASLYKDIHSLVNNLNIRHNNVEKTSKNYHKLVAEMNDEALEKWYDETYQMILLAFLRIDNVERAQKVRELNKSISEENNG